MRGRQETLGGAVGPVSPCLLGPLRGPGWATACPLRDAKQQSAWRVTSLAWPGTNHLMSKDLSSTKQRNKLSKKSFALPGKRKYPIPDKAHARNALARVAQHGSAAEQKKVRAAVKKRYPGLGDDK